MNEKLLYSKKETAALLSICTKTVEKLVARGELKARRVGRRVMFQRSEIIRFTQRDHFLQDTTRAVA